jgi:hypothetical protein
MLSMSLLIAYCGSEQPFVKEESQAAAAACTGCTHVQCPKAMVALAVTAAVAVPQLGKLTGIACKLCVHGDGASPLLCAIIVTITMRTTSPAALLQPRFSGVPAGLQATE